MPAKRMAGISRQAAKPGFFPQKALLPHLFGRGKRNCPSAISTPRLKLSNNTPAGRPRALASYQSAIFMGHSVYALSGGDRPADAGNVIGQLAAPAQSRRPEAGCFGRVRACNLAPKAQPVAPGEERVIHSPRPPDGWEKALLVPFGALAKRHCGAAPVCYRAESYCAAYAHTRLFA